MRKQAILCVDDEPIILLSLKATLNREFQGRYLVTTASDAASAMEAVEELEGEGTEVVLVLTDWLMPGLKGDEFLALVHDRYPSIASIMITGQADVDCVERAKAEYGLFACIRKPWTSAQLVGTVRACLASFTEPPAG